MGLIICQVGTTLSHHGRLGKWSVVVKGTCCHGKWDQLASMVNKDQSSSLVKEEQFPSLVKEDQLSSIAEEDQLFSMVLVVLKMDKFSLTLK